MLKKVLNKKIIILSSIICVFLFALTLIILKSSYQIDNQIQKIVIEAKNTYSSSDNKIDLEVYNFYDDKTINVNKIIYRKICVLDSTKCENFSVKEQISNTIASGEKKIITISNINDLFQNSMGMEIGVQYTIDGQQFNKTINVYKENSANVSIRNSKRTKNSESEEFRFELTSNNSFDIYVRLSEKEIYMDKGEKLGDLNLKYAVKSGITNKWFFDHPQTDNANKNKAMFGQTNTANISEFFSFSESELGATNSSNNPRSIDYSGISNLSSGYYDYFTIIGSPIKNASKQKIILGFYFEQYKDSWGSSYQNWSDQLTTASNGRFTSTNIPSFIVNIYDKSKLLQELNNFEEKYIGDNKTSKYDESDYYKYMIIYNNAVNAYVYRDYYQKCNDLNTNCSSTEVTDSEINYYYQKLKDANIKELPDADYTEYNKAIQKGLNVDYTMYESNSYNNFEKIFNQRSDYLNRKNTFQNEIDYYVEKLNKSIDMLIMLDADYRSLDELLSTISLVKNENYNKSGVLYTEESWNKLQESINAVDRNKKIDEQEVVNNYVNTINNAYSSLEYTNGNYTELNKKLDSLKDLENENYNKSGVLYTEESWNNLQEAISAVDKTKKANDQEIIDGYLSSINNAYSSLEYANGNYTELNKKLEALKNLKNENYNKSGALYTEESWNKLQEAISAVDKTKKANEQEVIDGYLSSINNAYSSLEYANGNYTELNKRLETLKDLKNENYNKSGALYTEESWNKLQEAISAVDKTKKANEQEVIDGYLSSINSAYSSLEYLEGNYTELNKKLHSLKDLKNENYNKSGVLYTEESWNILQEAINSVDKTKKANEQKIIDEYLSSINKAYNSLEYTAGDYTELNSLLSRVEQIDKEITYTQNGKEKTVSIYSNFDEIDKIIDSINKEMDASKQELIDSYVRNLNESINNLKKIDADYSEINTIVEEISKLDKNQYENFDEIEKALNKVEYGKYIDEQDKVSKMYLLLKEKLENLKKKTIEKDSSDNDNSTNSNEKDKNTQSNLNNQNNSSNNNSSSTNNNTNNNSNNSNSKPEAASKKPEIIKFTINGNEVLINDTIKHNVASNVTKANFEIELNDKKAKYEIIGDDNLIVGKNKYTIKVSLNDSTTVYNVIINRLKANTKLKELLIEGYNIDFNSNIYEYELKVSNDTENLVLNIFPEDNNSIVETENNESIKNGTVIKIKVKGNDDSETIYSIKIIKNKISKKPISIIVILSVIILTIIIFVMKKRKKYE